jgi:hypothetical protein
VQKFWLELPKTVEDAYPIDKAKGTTFWRDVTKKEIKNVCVAFDVRGEVLRHHWIIGNFLLHDL